MHTCEYIYITGMHIYIYVYLFSRTFKQYATDEYLSIECTFKQCQQDEDSSPPRARRDDDGVLNHRSGAIPNVATRTIRWCCFLLAKLVNITPITVGL